MRTNALDRFGTRLEQRFTRHEIAAMMENAGLRDLRFSEAPPFWCAVGIEGKRLVFIGLSVRLSGLGPAKEDPKGAISISMAKMHNGRSGARWPGARVSCPI